MTAKTKPVRRMKMNALSVAILLRELRAGESNQQQLAEDTGLSYRTVREFCLTLHKYGIIYIHHWELTSNNKMNVRIYALGQYPDMKKPVLTKAEIRVRSKVRMQRKRAAKTDSMLSILSQASL